MVKYDETGAERWTRMKRQRNSLFRAAFNGKYFILNKPRGALIDGSDIGAIVFCPPKQEVIPVS